MSKNHPFTKTPLYKIIARYWQAAVYVGLGILLRVWNFRNSLYFIYDQGRDALVLEKIVHGNPVLVGPTTGLGGLFLGPLWYYISLPGFVLSGGNPYGLCLYLILLSCLALPMFWFLSHKLFQEKIWAVVCAVLLAIVPGSIQASIFVWNPLLSVPLMTGALLAFWKARRSRVWLAIGFLLLSLTLQSEFAYAIFFLPIVFLLIPWIRQKLNWRDFAVSIAAGGITLLPQLLFELRNKFIMTTSLLHSMSDTSQSVSWQELWAVRPQQLLNVTRLLLLGESFSSWMYSAVLILLFVLAFFGLGRKLLIQKMSDEKSPKVKALEKSSLFLWKLTLLFAIIPYPFFMLWRGNHGYFFSYYVTAHFIFLLPLIVLGIREISQLGKRFQERDHVPFTPLLVRFAAVMCIGVFVFASYHHLDGVVFRPENNAGLTKMVSAVAQIYDWHTQDATDLSQPWVVKTYTANVYTEQYDYLLGWYGKSHHLAPPQTVLTGNEKIWYVMIESRAQAMPIFFNPWYATATKDGHKIREAQIGVVTIETWKK
jgi:hypothetical protein